MNWKINVELTAEEILSWITMFLIAWNPQGIFTGFFEEVGTKAPFFMAASGAGSKWAKKALDTITGGPEK